MFRVRIIVTNLDWKHQNTEFKKENSYKENETYGNKIVFGVKGFAIDSKAVRS